MPMHRDVEAWKGNPLSLQLRFVDDSGAPLDLTSRNLHFYATWTGGQMSKPSGSWVLANQSQIATRGIATLAFDKAEIALLPTGKSARYEVELDDQTRLYGHIVTSQWATNNV